MRFVCATLLALLSCMAQGQAFPSRAVTLVVPFSPGTGIDILARVIGPKLSEKWGQPVVVENKPGASGNIGSDFVAKSAPNGYTLMVTVNAFTVSPALYKNLPFDPASDFAPISKIALATYCFVVNPAVFPARDMAEAVAAMRANPGKYYFASPGNGTPHHVGMELLKLGLGLDVTHVPYKGCAGARQDAARTRRQAQCRRQRRDGNAGGAREPDPAGHDPGDEHSGRAQRAHPLRPRALGESSRRRKDHRRLRTIHRFEHEVDQ